MPSAYGGNRIDSSKQHIREDVIIDDSSTDFQMSLCEPLFDDFGIGRRKLGNKALCPWSLPSVTAGMFMLMFMLTVSLDRRAVPVFS